MERIIFDKGINERIIVETGLCNVVVESNDGVIDVQIIEFENSVEYVGDKNHRFVIRPTLLAQDGGDSPV